VRIRRAALALAAIAPTVLAGSVFAAPQPNTTFAPPASAAPAPVPVQTAPAAAPTAPAPATPTPGATPATPAAAKPVSFELVDRGDTVEIIAHNIKASRTAIFPVRSRLEVPIVGAPIAKRAKPTDATVKLIELDGEAVRSLSVKLGFERADVKALARFAQAIQVGDDLHLLVPRKVPVEGVAPRVPEPTLPPRLAAAVDLAVGQIGPRPDPTAARKAETRPGTPGEPPAAAKLGPKIEMKPDAKEPATAIGKPDAVLGAADASPGANGDPTVGPAPAPGKDVRPAAANTAKPAAESKPLKQALASDPSAAWSKIAIYAAIGLAAVGFGFWWMRKRRSQLATPASIEIIAQRSLGGKARIVWLSAGPREMIVSVTAQQVRMLGQWRKPDAAASLPVAQTHTDARLAFNEPIELPRRVTAEIPAVDKPLSPAVSGILRLRGRTSQMAAALPEDIATDDVVADELWAKEILAATGARR
jgi:flagellar biogenesis protein FliO